MNGKLYLLSLQRSLPVYELPGVVAELHLALIAQALVHQLHQILVILVFVTNLKAFIISHMLAEHRVGLYLNFI